MDKLFVEGSGGGNGWWQTASRKAQEKVESMFDKRYEHLQNMGTHGTRPPVVEGSGHPSNPIVNGKFGIQNEDDEDDEDDDDDDDNDDYNENLNNYIPGKSSL